MRFPPCSDNCVVSRNLSGGANIMGYVMPSKFEVLEWLLHMNGCPWINLSCDNQWFSFGFNKYVLMKSLYLKWPLFCNGLSLNFPRDLDNQFFSFSFLSQPPKFLLIRSLERHGACQICLNFFWDMYNQFFCIFFLCPTVKIYVDRSLKRHGAWHMTFIGFLSAMSLWGCCAFYVLPSTTLHNIIVSFMVGMVLLFFEMVVVSYVNVDTSLCAGVYPTLVC